jgi:prepilin-type N-terminal cleavage/methylation domain-containing protein
MRAPPALPRRPRGFTLVELVFALAIGTSLLSLATGLIAQVSLRVGRARAVLREQALHEAASCELGDWLQQAEHIAINPTLDDLAAQRPSISGLVLAIRLPGGVEQALEFQPAETCGEPVSERARLRAGRLRLHRGGETRVWLELVTPRSESTNELFSYQLGLPCAEWDLLATRTGTGWKRFEASTWRVAGSPLRMR